MSVQFVALVRYDELFKHINTHSDFTITVHSSISVTANSTLLPRLLLGNE